MRTFHSRFLAALALLLFCAVCAVCRAGVSAVVFIHQPIITSGEVYVIETPKGFMVMPIPFTVQHYHGRPPYYAVARANSLLTDAPASRPPVDANLASLAGVIVASSIEDDIVEVHFEALKIPVVINTVTTDDIAEATIECIRRMARGEKKRPILKITGKKGEEAKWLRWQEKFKKHDLAKPFKRPAA